MRNKRISGFTAKLNEVHGTKELCAWLVYEKDGVQTVRIQTRNPAFLKPILKLGTNRNPQVKPVLAAHAVRGGYLRAYQIEMPVADAVAFVLALLERTAANAA